MSRTAGDRGSSRGSRLGAAAAPAARRPGERLRHQGEQEEQPERQPTHRRSGTDPLRDHEGCANRDPRQFQDPDTLDIARKPNLHVAFGHGAHHCLGAALARAELQEAFAFLAPRMRDLRLAGEPVYDTPLGVHGLHALPISFARA